MTAYRFYYYETKERTHEITALFYWIACYEFNKKHPGVRAWRAERVE